MAPRNSLGGLKTRVRSRADMPGDDDFVSDDDLTDFINDSLEDLYEMIVQCDAQYFEETSALAIVSGTAAYALPSDFYRLNGVDIQIDGQSDEYFSVRSYTNPERNRQSHQRTWRMRDYEAMRYMLRGREVHFTPTPASDYTGRILYVPYLETLHEDEETVPESMAPGWLRWAVVDAAIKCLAKQEDDTTALERDREKIENKIRDAFPNRDANEPIYVADIRGATPGRSDEEGDWY